MLDEVKCSVNELTGSSIEDDNLKRKGSDLSGDSESSKKPRNDDGKSDNSNSSSSGGSCSSSSGGSSSTPVGPFSTPASEGSSSTPASGGSSETPCSGGSSEPSNNRDFSDNDHQILILNIILNIVIGGEDDF